MKARIVFALPQEEALVQELLNEVDLGLAGDIEDHVVLKTAGRIKAVGKLQPTGRNRYHLEVFGVQKHKRGSGLGELLLLSLMEAPGKYCRFNEQETSGGSHSMGPYRITTVAKGGAADFYGRYGFKSCSFAELESNYFEQCNSCSDQDDCQPVPMIFEQV